MGEHLLGITKLDKEKNQCIRKKTGAQNIVQEIKQYQKKWLQHVQRMDTNRIPKQTLQYKPKGLRNIGRLKKRWRDQFHFEDTWLTVHHSITFYYYQLDTRIRNLYIKLVIIKKFILRMRIRKHA